LATISVESVVDQHSLAVYLIKNPVSVLLQSCGEHHHFEDLAHLLQELDGVRPGLESASALVEMNKGLVQVKDQSVFSLLGFRPAQSVHRRKKVRVGFKFAGGLLGLGCYG